MSRKAENGYRTTAFVVFCLGWSFGHCNLVPKYSKTVLFSATSDLTKLIQTESRLVDYLNNYIEQEEANLDRLKRFLVKAKESQTLLLDHGADSYLNLVNIFLSLKRVDEWRLLEEHIRNGTEKSQIDLIRKDPKDALVLPAESDLTGAANALFRLQDTYNLKAEVLSDGQLMDTLHTETLSASECFELGRMASTTLKDTYHALIWYIEAWRKQQLEDPPTVSTTELLDTMATALYVQGNPEHALYALRKLNEHDPNYTIAKDGIEFYENDLRSSGKDPSRLPKQWSDLPQIVNTRPNDGHLETRDEYEALCRGEGQDETERSKLYCYYQSNTPYSRLAPFKVELMRSEEPRVVIFRNIVTNQEVEMLKSLAEPKFYTTEHLLLYRVSKSAWVSDYEDALVRSLSSRISQATGLSIESAEPLHLSCYGIGGHYETHHDYYAARQLEDPTYAKTYAKTGNRIATVLVYLSTPALGGGTVFPMINLALQATKNDAAFWFNLHRNGTVNPNTVHAACPVLAGMKWIGNKWLHERGQEFRLRCKLENV